MALTALKVKNAKPGRYVDGRGLCLFVKESGSRSWVLRMQHNGRRRDYGLGSALDVTLTEARDAAAALRRQVRAGIDPVAERRKSRKVVPSFETAARECYEALKDGWKNQNYRNWISSMENHVFPLIGRKPVDQVDSTHVVEVLTPIWLEIPDTPARFCSASVPCSTSRISRDGAKKRRRCVQSARDCRARPTRSSTSRPCPMRTFRRS